MSQCPSYVGMWVEEVAPNWGEEVAPNWYPPSHGGRIRKEQSQLYTHGGRLVPSLHPIELGLSAAQLRWGEVSYFICIRKSGESAEHLGAAMPQGSAAPNDFPRFGCSAYPYSL